MVAAPRLERPDRGRGGVLGEGGGGGGGGGVVAEVVPVLPVLVHFGEEDPAFGGDPDWALVHTQP